MILVSLVETEPHSGALFVAFTPRPFTVVMERTTPDNTKAINNRKDIGVRVNRQLE